MERALQIEGSETWNQGAREQLADCERGSECLAMVRTGGQEPEHQALRCLR